ncbi:MAG: histidine kinase [bacterium]|nr:histidine kinase [bacterium]
MGGKHLGIKAKLMLVSILLSFLMTAVLCLVFWNNTTKWERKQSAEEIQNRLAVALVNVEKDYMQIWSLMSTLSNNQLVDEYISMSQSRLDSRLEYQSDPRSNAGHIVTQAYDEIDRIMVQYQMNDLIAKGLLVSNSHNMDMLFGKDYGHSSDRAYMQSFFEGGDGNFPAGIVKSPFFYAASFQNYYIIPITAKVYSYNGSRYLGDVYIAISSNWLEKQLRSYGEETKDEVLIRLGNRVYSYCNQEFQEVTEEFLGLFEDEMTAQNGKVTPVPWGEEKNEYIVVAGDNGSIDFAQRIPEYSLTLAQFGGSWDIAFYVCLMCLIVVLLYLVLNYMIKRPIMKICGQLHQIAQGNFSVQREIETGDEFQMISDEIVRMAQDIQKLMDKTIQAEKDKQNYQFQMLQYQINPHFMYNTLNSIRWMGEINGIPGIVDMTTAFAKVLRRTFRSSDYLVNLEDEIQFIKDYSMLQAYRYGNAFEVQYEVDESLYSARVIKFTLQPLVENAVFHGVEASRSKCLIRVGARKEGKNLVLFVWDDGVGIAAENLKKLNDFQAGKKDKISGIGIANIHERIQIEFGTQYGVHIDSREGEYTCVTVTMPLLDGTSVFEETGGGNDERERHGTENV